MTNEEAVDLLMRDKKRNYEEGSLVRYWEAFDMGVKALEKQIPKKATLNKMKLPACPECGCALAYNINEATNKIYCYKCGQAIDWSK